MKNVLLVNTHFEELVTDTNQGLANTVDKTICHASQINQFKCTYVYVDPIDFSYDLHILSGPFFGDYAWAIAKESNF